MPFIVVSHRIGSISSRGGCSFLVCIQSFQFEFVLLPTGLLHVCKEAIVSEVILIEVFPCVIGLPPTANRHVLPNKTEIVVMVIKQMRKMRIKMEVVNGAKDI